MSTQISHYQLCRQSALGQDMQQIQAFGNAGAASGQARDAIGADQLAGQPDVLPHQPAAAASSPDTVALSHWPNLNDGVQNRVYDQPDGSRTVLCYSPAAHDHEPAIAAGVMINALSVGPELEVDLHARDAPFTAVEPGADWHARDTRSVSTELVAGPQQGAAVDPEQVADRYAWDARSVHSERVADRRPVEALSADLGHEPNMWAGPPIAPMPRHIPRASTSVNSELAADQEVRDAPSAKPEREADLQPRDAPSGVLVIVSKPVTVTPEHKAASVARYDDSQERKVDRRPRHARDAAPAQKPNYRVDRLSAPKPPYPGTEDAYAKWQAEGHTVIVEDSPDPTEVLAHALDTAMNEAETEMDTLMAPADQKPATKGIV